MADEAQAPSVGERQMVAIRALYEVYRVPVSAISRATAISLEWLDGKKERENWTFDISVEHVCKRLERAFLQHTRNLVGTAPKPDGEKTARALSLLAKGLESLEAINSRRGFEQEENGGRADDREAAADRRGAMDLDLELARLVESLAEPGGAA